MAQGNLGLFILLKPIKAGVRLTNHLNRSKPKVESNKPQTLFGALFERRTIMKNVLAVTLILMLGVLGIVGGVYLGYITIESTHMIHWNWYQPSEGPDMGRWKQGPSGDGFAFLVMLLLTVMGSSLGSYIGLLITKCFPHSIKSEDPSEFFLQILILLAVLDLFLSALVLSALT